MEQATREHEEVVSRIYGEALERNAAEKPLTPGQRIVYAVEHLMQEVNSGASFEQYFRWADVEEIGAICATLRSLGLDDVAGLTDKAIRVAFPSGLSASDEEKDDLTDWSEDQERQLQALFAELEELNGRVTNALGAHALRIGA